jgi:hypothetical protein
VFVLKLESRSTQRLGDMWTVLVIYSLAEKVRESVMGHLYWELTPRAMTRTSDVTGNGDDVIGAVG